MLWIEPKSDIGRRLVGSCLAGRSIARFEVSGLDALAVRAARVLEGSRSRHVSLP